MPKKEQWQIDMENAANAAAETAGETTEPTFVDLARETAHLQGLFDELKLNDQETYDKLVEIVDQAARGNDSIADIVNRINKLGQAGMGLIGTIDKIASGGAVAALQTALKSKR